MRLLVRANSHRPIADGVVGVASSPDTPHREKWLWSVQLGGPAPLGDHPAGVQVLTVAGDGDPRSTVVLAYDPDVVEATLERFDEAGDGRFRRDRRQVAVLISGSDALIEGRHRLAAGDAIILEGDDATDVTVGGIDAEPVRLIVARLSYVDGTRMAWVP